MTTFLLIIWTLTFIIHLLILKDNNDGFIKFTSSVIAFFAFTEILIYTYKLFQSI